MEYFAQFPTILYTFDPNLYDFRTVVNIFAKVKIIDAVMDNGLVYYQYPMKDSDTAEVVASKYYGDTKRHWMVFFANQVTDPYFDMPLKDNDLQNNIILKYGSLANAQATLYQVIQYVNVATTLGGTTNTISYMSTLDQPYTYNFTTNQLQGVTLPTIMNPILPQGTTTVTNSDGSVVTTTTTWIAQSAYDFYYAQNEAKRQVNLLDNQYATQLETELKSLLGS